METILAFLEGSVEWQTLKRDGLLNVNTLSSIGVCITSAFELWGLWKQNQTIWRMRSGLSVSMTTFSYTCWFFLTGGIYNIYIDGAVAVVNGIATALLQVPILIGIWRFKKLHTWEKALSLALILMPVSMGLLWSQTPDTKSAFFAIVSLGVLFAMGAQPLELFTTKQTGACDIRLFGIYVFSSVVWFVYAITIGDPAMIFSVGLGGLITLATPMLWCWYRVSEPHPPALLVPLLLMKRARR